MGRHSFCLRLVAGRMADILAGTVRGLRVHTPKRR